MASVTAASRPTPAARRSLMWARTRSCHCSGPRKRSRSPGFPQGKNAPTNPGGSLVYSPRVRVSSSLLNAARSLSRTVTFPIRCLHSPEVYLFYHCQLWGRWPFLRAVGQCCWNRGGYRISPLPPLGDLAGIVKGKVDAGGLGLRAVAGPVEDHLPGFQQAALFHLAGKGPLVEDLEDVHAHSGHLGLSRSEGIEG